MKGSLEGRVVTDTRRNQIKEQTSAFEDVTHRAAEIPLRTGSTLGETMAPIKRRTKNHMKKVVIGKDVDFLSGPDLFLRMTKREKEEFIEVLLKDVGFLRKVGIMDYSMLLAVAFDRELFRKSRTAKSTGALTFRYWRMLSSEKSRHNCVWSFGIIDYLQAWDAAKKIEHTSIALFSKEKANLASCIEPVSYGERFLSFVNWIIQEDSLHSHHNRDKL